MVQKKVKEVIWSVNGEKQYYQILEHLSEEAPHVIDKVGNALLDTIEALSVNYNHYPADRFRKNNDGKYKAALIYSYRVSYYVGETSVRILRIRHTSREPLNY